MTTKGFGFQKGESPSQASLEMLLLLGVHSPLGYAQDCMESFGQQLSAGSLRFGVISAWRQKQYHSPNNCFIFCLITLIVVSVAQTGLGGKSPRKQAWEAPGLFIYFFPPEL